MGITAAALALVLVLSAALVIALRARAEAERQRAEAEGLVEFMLTDLRDKLKGTGDPKIMATVNQRALSYYSQQQLDTLPDESLNRRARVLHAMGEDEERLGRFPSAQDHYREAWRITDEVLSRHPDDPDAIFAHAQSEFWVGKAAWEEGDFVTTELHWKAYLSKSKDLSHIEPQTTRSLMELGYAYGNLCELTARRDKSPAGALALCEKASDLMRLALGKQPNDAAITHALANRLGWQADQYLLLGQLDKAKALRNEEAQLVDRLLVADPHNIDLQVRRQWPEAGLGKISVARGETAPALQRWKRSFKVFERLAKLQPNDKSLTEQKFRLAWLIARNARSPEEKQTYSRSARASYLQLSALLNEAQLKKFTDLLEQL
jgi:tetratricopeptide (TPR) repeat protein